MRVAVVRDYDKPLVLEEWPDPVPTGDEVVVTIDAAELADSLGRGASDSLSANHVSHILSDKMFRLTRHRRSSLCVAR